MIPNEPQPKLQFSHIYQIQTIYGEHWILSDCVTELEEVFKYFLYTLPLVTDDFEEPLPQTFDPFAWHMGFLLQEFHSEDHQRWVQALHLYSILYTRKQFARELKRIACIYNILPDYMNYLRLHNHMHWYHNNGD